MKNINKKNWHSLACFFILIGFALLFSLGCKKEWLEAKADKKQTVPATVKDFQAMLDFVDRFNFGINTLREIASDNHYYIESYFASASVTVQNPYTWTTIMPYSSTSNYSLGTYGQSYNRILNLNVILTEAEKSTDKDYEGLEHVKAQALFNRARLLFDIAQTFAPPYKSNTANSDLGIALRLSTDITEVSKRSSLKQTYDQIIADLNSAKETLPITPLFLTRASKPAALGLLAKVYLSMREYSKAFDMANEYLSIKKDLLNYNTINPSSGFIGVNPEVAFLEFLTAGSSTATNYLIDQSLYDSYNENDIRKKAFFNVSGAGITFKGYYSNTPNDIFVGISTDEMYLIRAEGYARMGNISAAMKDLNDLLRTRWAKNADGSTKYVDQTAINEDDALIKILTERRKQLILRNVRWSDLRRLNQEPKFAVTLTRTIGGNTYTLEPNSYRYTFPYPEEVIQASGMQQNVGW